MKEYIEREQAIALFYPVDPENDGSDGCTIVYKSGNFSSSEIEAMLLDLPAADVAEVRHGRWERVSTASGIISRVRCSVCAGTQPLTFENMPYCPTCGARMDEEDGHEIS